MHELLFNILILIIISYYFQCFDNKGDDSFFIPAIESQCSQ